MNIFMYTNRFGVYMAGKLYWRIKKDGKWTWKKCDLVFADRDYLNHQVHALINLGDVETDLGEEE